MGWHGGAAAHGAAAMVVWAGLVGGVVYLCGNQSVSRHDLCMTRVHTK